MKNQFKFLSKKYTFFPSKRLGQNFLIDKETIRKIIKNADLKKSDTIIEVGPGFGALTFELAKKVKKLIAVEKDFNVIKILRKTTENYNNIEIIQSDILKLKLHFKNSYKVVANLPFYLTAPTIRKFLEKTKKKPEQMVLVVQKEVGQRICAHPPKMNVLAISVQFYAQPKIIGYVSKKSFWPSPKVDAAIIKLKTADENLEIDKNLFFKIVKAGFSHPRKQILNNLSKSLKINKEKAKKWLLENNIMPEQRAETLEFKKWLDLLKTFLKKNGNCYQ